MKIGFVALDYPTTQGGGGVGTVVQTLARALAGQGHQIRVVALQVPGKSTCSDDGDIRLVRFQQGSIHWYLSKVPFIGPWLALSVRELERSWDVWRIIQRLDREQPFDLIEITEEAGFCLAIFMRHVPVVSRLHGEHYTFYKYTPAVAITPGIRLSRLLQRIALRRARVLISPSRAHAREIAAELGPNRPPIKVIPNTVTFLSKENSRPLPNFAGSKTDTQVLTTNDPMVLYVGRLERHKGVPILLEAAHQVLQVVRKVQFVLAGGNHPTLEKKDLESLVKRFSLNGNVHFLGHVPRDQLPMLYRRATLCVLPSYYETFGIAALEPMSFGVPVVATAAGALPELVVDGVTGVLVPPGDPKVLAEAILRLLLTPTLRNRMSKAAHQHSLYANNLEKVVSQTLRVYNSFVCSSG